MELDEKIEHLRRTFEPLQIKTKMYCRKDVYYITFENTHPGQFYPIWASTFEVVNPLVKSVFPTATPTKAGPHKVSFRLGSLFDFLSQIKQL